MIEPLEIRERLIAAAMHILDEHGPAELTVRRVAEAAGSSTMGIYSRFGGRAGMLEAVYRRGFEQLRDAISAVAPEEPPGRILSIAHAYRRFALAGPARYAFSFERPVPDFDPAPDLRREALAMAFTPLVDAVAAAQRAGVLAGTEPVRPAYLIWTMLHGVTSIELTHASRSPLPGWFLDSPDAGAAVLTDGLQAVLSGLR